MLLEHNPQVQSYRLQLSFVTYKVVNPQFSTSLITVSRSCFAPSIGAINHRKFGGGGGYCTPVLSDFQSASTNCKYIYTILVVICQYPFSNSFVMCKFLYVRTVSVILLIESFNSLPCLFITWVNGCVLTCMRNSAVLPNVIAIVLSCSTRNHRLSNVSYDGLLCRGWLLSVPRGDIPHVYR